MKRNRYLLAAVLGALSPVSAELVSLLLVSLGLGNQDIFRIDSLFISLNRPSITFGFITTAIVGGALGVILLYLLDRFSAEHVVVKAMGISLFTWFLFKLFSVAFIESRLVDARPFGVYYNHIISSLVNGAVLGFLFKFTLFQIKKQI